MFVCVCVGSLSRDAAFSHRMVLCIATQDSHSLSHLSLRFGASLKSCRHLLEKAKKSHVEVVGVSFHIGSGCPDPQAYAQSIADARLVFQMGAELGHMMNILDLGGGFPGLEGAKVRFEETKPVRPLRPSCTTLMRAFTGSSTQSCLITPAPPPPCRREALRGQLLPGEDQNTEDVCKPLSCGWEITDTLCVGPVFTPASIM